ncbi:MAG: hypothetical protein E7090_00100 [Bacteroidales bacterium]|nr:hypothetical protein [Bacteroidales bacterium]
MKKLSTFLFFFLCMTTSFAQIAIGNAVSNDTWQPSDFVAVENDQITDVVYGLVAKTSDVYCQTEGIATVTLSYLEGSGSRSLHTLGVELLDENGDVVSADYHRGSTGYSHSNNVYKLPVTNEVKQIRYYADNYDVSYGGIDCSGTITIVVEKAILSGNSNDTWEPAHWSVAEAIPAEVAALTEYFVAPYVKTSESLIELEQGYTSFTFVYEAGQAALRIGGVELVDFDGNVVASDYHYGLAGINHTDNVYNISVMSAGKYILRYYCENKSGANNSNGHVDIKTKPILSGNCTDTWEPAHWSVAEAIPAEVAALTEYFVAPYVKTSESLIELEQGNTSFTFVYEAGQAALRIGGVELVDFDGNVVASDYHYGLAGASHTDNVYNISVMSAGKYILRYYCENKSGANNSNGHVDIKSIASVDANGVNPQTVWCHISSGEVDMSAPFMAIAAADIPQGVLALDEAIQPSHVRVMERIVNVTDASSLDIEFSYVAGKCALNLAGVDFVDADGNVVASHYKLYDEGLAAGVISKYTLAPLAPGVYTMRSFVQLSGEGGTRVVNSKGNITFAAKTGAITITNDMPLQDVGDWSKETFVASDNVPADIAAASKSGVRVMTAIVNVTETGMLLDVNFDWNEGSGSKSLDIVGVDIVDGNGNVLAKDYKYNQYGSNTKNGPLSSKKYTLNVPKAGLYVVRYFNGEPADGSTSSTRTIDSEGDIYFSTATKEFALSTADYSHNYYYMRNENGEYLSTKGGAVSLVANNADATKFYLGKEGDTYSLLSFDQGLYVDFNGASLAIAGVGEKYAFTLGQGFASSSSVIVKCEDSYLAADLTMTADLTASVTWVLEEVQSLSFSISTLRHASLCLPVEVAIPDGVQVYVYNSITYNADGVTGTLDLVRINDYIPAGEAVLLYSATPLDAATSFDFDITNTGAQLPEGTENHFLGTYAKSVIMEETGMTHMYLTKPADKEVGFYKRKMDNDANGDGTPDSFILGANKLYFTLTPQQVASLSRRFSFNYMEGTTGIENVEQDGNVGNGVIYDLSGRAVENVAAPGIYIVNGKKILVK